MGALPEVAIYSKELSKFRYGFPLYNPDPAESYDKVRIGDVGHITKEGKFKRLFNVFYPEDHAINHLGVPDGFAPLDEKLKKSDRSIQPTAGVISSMVVTKRSGSVSFECTKLPAGFEATCKCDKKQGAALGIIHPGVLTQAEYKKDLRQLMQTSYGAWYTYVVEKLGVDDKDHFKMEDIRLVIGHVLTSEWSTLVVEKKSQECEVQFKVGVDPISGSVRGSWSSESSLSFPTRSGPTRLPPILPEERHDDAPFPRHREFIEVVPSGAENVPYSPPANQCIFLHSLRVKDRAFFGKTIKAEGEKKADGHKGPDEEDLVTVVSSDSDLESNSSDTPGDDNDLSCQAWDYIFNNSDAEVAILDDDDVYQFRVISGIDSESDVVYGKATFSADGEIAVSSGSKISRQIQLKVELVDGVKVGSMNFNVEHESKNSPSNKTPGDEKAREDISVMHKVPQTYPQIKSTSVSTGVHQPTWGSSSDSGKHSKMNLNNYCQRNRMKTPTYNSSFSRTSSEATWTSVVELNGRTFKGGQRSSKSEAEGDAAKQALDYFLGSK